MIRFKKMSWLVVGIVAFAGSMAGYCARSLTGECG